MFSFIHDLRVALRDLRHRPTFAATVILTLAIGIGASTAAFALVDAVFLTPLPVRDQDQLVTLSTRLSATDSEFPLPWSTQQLLVDQHRSFGGVAAWRAYEPWWYAARDGDRTVPIGRTAVSGNFFDVLGVRPQLGRLLQPDDDTPGGPDLLVLSDKAWRRDFGADPRILGRLLVLVGGTYRVIGVAPPEFSFPDNTDAWSPVVRELHNRWGASPDDWRHYQFGLVGRPRPSATLRSARTDLESALRADSATGRYRSGSAGYPPQLPTAGVVERYVDVVLGQEVRPSVAILFCAVGLVLLIACTNVAGLLLARGMSRASELAVRAALGASWQHLASQLLVESVLLGAVGGVIGVAIATALVRAAVVLAPAELPMIATAHVDLGVLVFASTVTAIATLSAGLAPAMRGARPDAQAALRGNRSVTGGPLTQLTRQFLVAVQVALALAVLSAAGLLAGTVVSMQRLALGFDAPQ